MCFLSLNLQNTDCTWQCWIELINLFINQMVHLLWFNMSWNESKIINKHINSPQKKTSTLELGKDTPGSSRSRTSVQAQELIFHPVQKSIVPCRPTQSSCRPAPPVCHCCTHQDTACSSSTAGALPRDHVSPLALMHARPYEPTPTRRPEVAAYVRGENEMGGEWGAGRSVAERWLGRKDSGASGVGWRGGATAAPRGVRAEIRRRWHMAGGQGQLKGRWISGDIK